MTHAHLNTTEMLADPLFPSEHGGLWAVREVEKKVR